MSRKTFQILTILAAALGPLLAIAAAPAPTKAQATLINGQPIPSRGAASTRPADRWEWAMVSGNGRMGALVFGQPLQETIIVNHGRLWLPLGSREVVPDLAKYVPDLREIIRTKDYNAAMRFFLGKAREQGFPGLIWTDPGHLGFKLKIKMAGGSLDGSRDTYPNLGQADAVSHGWQSPQDNASVAGKPLEIGKTRFNQGIGMHAPAELVYTLDGKYQWLTFHAGTSSEMTGGGSVVVQVWLDGKKTMEPPVLRMKQEPRYFSVPVAGTRQLRIVTTDAGDGIGADHINLCNLRLMVGKQEPAPDKSGDASAESAGTGVRNYLRTEDFRTGEVAVRWQGSAGGFCRRLFVSRPDNVIVLSIRGPKPGAVACDLNMGSALNKLIQCEVKTQPGWITSQNVYVKGKGGYNSLVRVVNRGGQMTCDGQKVPIAGADEVLALMRVEPWRELLEGSDAWAYSPKNPAVASAKPVTVESLKPALAALPADYEALLAPHARVHAEIFDRVTLDLGGGADRNLPTDELLERAAVDKKLSPALLEKMYDAGRYMFLCASGELPPNLFGIWTGTWTPAWPGDFTTDTNLQRAVASGFSANMPELMDG